MGAAPEPNEEALRLFSEYLAAREQGALDFETWVRTHPEHERELRGMHAAWLRAHALAGQPRARPGRGGAAVARHLAGRGARGARGARPRQLRRRLPGRDRLLDREVALKVLSGDARLADGARRRFLEEARVLARIDHPNVVRIHAVDARDGEIRLVLELVKGRTLSDLCRATGRSAGTRRRAPARRSRARWPRSTPRT